MARLSSKQKGVPGMGIAVGGLAVVSIGAVVTVTLLSRRAAAQAGVLPPESIDWLPARLTEFFPDAPASMRKMEGGPRDWNSRPLITLQQHQRDPVRYPYVSVASDFVLQRRPVAYGTRIYFELLPGIVFRLVDTGGHFYGSDKQIRVPGHEPFDIATDYDARGRLGGKLTRYHIDPSDYLPPLRFNPKVARLNLG